jgi:hypothetical protein
MDVEGMDGRGGEGVLTLISLKGLFKILFHLFLVLEVSIFGILSVNCTFCGPYKRNKQLEMNTPKNLFMPHGLARISQVKQISEVIE